MNWNEFWLDIHKRLVEMLFPTPRGGVGATIELGTGYRMRTAILTRQKPSTDEGTFGDWLSDSGWSCKTGELPDRGNACEISCVPCGTYRAVWRWSKAHGKNLYHLINVPMRSEVEIHSGNVCGDVSKGYASEVKGCILPGLSVGVFPTGTKLQGGKLILGRDQLGVEASVSALSKLEADMCVDNKQQDFDLTIKETA